MNEAPKSVVISKEDAVFWMDGNGKWHNEHGRFEHPKIIKYFNGSIQKDDGGYHLFQIRDGLEEKVYFKYEETALFAVDLAEKEEIILLLNTGKRIILDPSCLYEKEDSLYFTWKDHLVKFTDRALFKLSDYLTEQEGELTFSFKDSTWKIAIRP